MRVLFKNNWRMHVLNISGIMALIVFNGYTLFSQTAHKYLLEGDKSYDMNDFSSAEINYRKAKEKVNDPKTNYNLGNSLMKQKRFQEAVEEYQRSVHKIKDDSLKSKVYHNIGNAFYQTGNYIESIESYKEALRLNSSDAETRKNLAMAKEKIKSEKQKEENNKSRDKNDKKENERDDNKKKESPEKEQQDKNKSKEQNQNRISRNEMEKLLKNIEADENEIHKKVIKGKTKSEKRKKDW